MKELTIKLNDGQLIIHSPHYTEGDVLGIGETRSNPTLKELNIISEAVERARTKLINQQSDTARKNQTIGSFDKLILKISKQGEEYSVDFVLPRKISTDLDLKCTKTILQLDEFVDVTLHKSDFTTFDITDGLVSMEQINQFAQNFLDTNKDL